MNQLGQLDNHVIGMLRRSAELQRAQLAFNWFTSLQASTMSDNYGPSLDTNTLCLFVHCELSGS